MTVTVFPDGNYVTADYSVAQDATETTVYTVPSSYGGGGLRLMKLWANDQDGTANAVTMRVTVNGGSARTLLTAQVMAANTAFEKEFGGMVLRENDTVKLTFTTATVDGYLQFVAATAPV